MSIERYPSKPYIKDGYPKNITVLINTTAEIECPIIIADLEPFIQFLYLGNQTDMSEDGGPPTNATLLQVVLM